VLAVNADLDLKMEFLHILPKKKEDCPPFQGEAGLMQSRTLASAAIV
jgi:hypothetical protein